MINLTDRQQDLLFRAARLTHFDDSGRGYWINDGYELRVFENLASLGLVSIGSANLWARTTKKGYQLFNTLNIG